MSRNINGPAHGYRHVLREHIPSCICLAHNGLVVDVMSRSFDTLSVPRIGWFLGDKGEMSATNGC